MEPENTHRSWPEEFDTKFVQREPETGGQTFWDWSASPAAVKVFIAELLRKEREQSQPIVISLQELGI